MFFVAFFFRRFAEELLVGVLKIYSTHIRKALDTPPREAGIPSLARETYRLIVFVRGFFGKEDKETEKRKF